MTLWLKRELVRGLIRSVAFGLVCVLVFLFLIWLVSSSGNSGAGNRVYKNYVETYFVSEIMADKETYEKRMAGNALLSDKDQREGTFVVVSISGPIYGEDAQRIWDQLYIAARITKNMKAIIFLINSPGGGVTESDYFFEEIRRMKTRGIKTVAFVDSLSASGAYYMTAHSDRIIASPTAVVGSIGVIWKAYNIEELSRKIGVSVDVIKSSAMKDIGSPFKKMSDDENAVLYRIVDYNYQRFKSIIHKSRGLSVSEIELVANGGIWHSEDAKRLGLTDEIGYVNRAVDVAMELTGVRSPRVVKYEEEATFWDIFSSRSPAVRLITNLNNAVSNPSISTPKLLYMWIP